MRTKSNSEHPLRERSKEEIAELFANLEPIELPDGPLTHEGEPCVITTCTQEPCKARNGLLRVKKRTAPFCAVLFNYVSALTNSSISVTSLSGSIITFRIISSFNSCKSNCSVVCTCSLICFHLLSEKLTFALDGHGSAYEQHLSDRRLHDRVESIISVHSVTSMLCISSLTDTPDRSATKEKRVPR